MASYFIGNSSFATVGGTPASLDYYEVFESEFTFGGPLPNTNVTVRIVRLGSLVTFHVIDFITGIAGVSANFTSVTNIPTRFLATDATSNTFAQIVVTNNAFVRGTININNTTGQIIIYNGDFGVNTFINGNISGFPSFAVSWTV